MEMHSTLVFGLMGACGAFIFEAFRWVGLRYDDSLPHYFRRVHYWLLTLLLVAIGGLFTVFLEPKSWAQAFFIGLSAPASLTRILAASAVEKPVMGSDSDRTTFQRWLRG